jgi:hypothetical protein
VRHTARNPAGESEGHCRGGPGGILNGVQGSGFTHMQGFNG